MGEAILPAHAKAASETGTQCTRGRWTFEKLHTRRTIKGEDGDLLGVIESGMSDENADHLEACQHAIEDHCNGNPEAVGTVFRALGRLATDPSSDIAGGMARILLRAAGISELASKRKVEVPK